MTVRPPQNLRQPGLAQTGLGILEYELMAERSSALGRTGLAAEAALAALAALAAGQSIDDTARERLVDKAAEAVWAMFIQREICGLRNGREVIARYGIPGAVLARLGARPRHPDP